MENLIGQVDGMEISRDALESTDVDQKLKEQEESINVTRKQSYLSSRNLAKEAEASGKPKETPWHEYDVPVLTEKLGVDHMKGLTSAEAEDRLKQYGLNELYKPKRPGFWLLFLLQLSNLIIILLIIAAFASVFVNVASGRTSGEDYAVAIAIFLIVILNSAIGAYTENSAAGALEALAKLSQPKATVLRDGKEIQVKSNHIVPGDVVLLTTGDITPADIRLINADDFKVNEMLLTGEPDDVNKFARMKKKKKADEGGHDEGEKLTPENMAFSSCMVTNGKAKAYVVETGMNTRVGKIAQLLAQSTNDTSVGSAIPDDLAKAGAKKKKKEFRCCPCLPDTTSGQTPLQKSLQDLGVKMGVIAIVVCTIVFIIGVALNVTDLSYPDQPSWLYMILISVTLAVAAIPEGIPLCVTISLSTGCSDMVKKNVLVRRIVAVETLGCASVICTDKTGTLTEGKMTMVKMWSGGVDYDVSGKGFNPTIGKITFDRDGTDASTSLGVMSTLTSAILCCNATVQEEKVDGEMKWVPRGNSSEAPIVVAAAKIGVWASNFDKATPRLYEVPFSSSRKMMLTLCQLYNESGDSSTAKKYLAPFFKNKQPKYIANVKGAPNFMLDLCDSWVDANGNIVPLQPENRSAFLQKVDALSSQALRVLAVAARVIDTLPFDPTDKELEWSTDRKFDSVVKQPGLTLLGLVASIDPERDGVAQAVLDANGGHIRVVMITGDYLPTAIAIAHNVNILKPEDDVHSCALGCASLRPNGQYLDADSIDNLTRTIKVFARAQPEDKLEIVKSMQRQGLVSAMTGDGVNDAPALKKADIGVAMGIQGTEVAKGASDMILTDDNFVSIVVAVEKGRIIYAGIQKFVSFILSVHLAEVLQIFLCIVASIPIMRTPLQILFLILVTDLPPSIALGMERVAPGILKKRPRPKTEPIILGWMWWGIVLNGLILVISCFGVYIWGLSYYLEGRFTNNQILELVNEVGTNCTTPGPYDPITDDTCIPVKLDLARTTAFISLVWSENIRAYTSRSFNQPIWVSMCSNPAMQKAILVAQIALYVAIFVPGLSDVILGLRGYQVGGEGWLAAFVGACATLIMCEVYKVLSGPCITAQEKESAERSHQAEQKRLEEIAERQKRMAAEKAASMPQTA